MFPYSTTQVLQLYYAVCKRGASRVRFIFRRGLYMEPPFEMSSQIKLRAALWRAVNNGDTEIVRLLLEAGVSPEIQDIGEE